MKAKDLIRQAQQDQAKDVPPEAVKALKQVLAYNDTAPHKRRVTMAATLPMLVDYGWTGVTRYALEALCRKLGRKNFGSP